jgi:DNA-binding MarR family transcriptional regulator
MKDAELAFRTGELFNTMITDAFWDSFKGELGRVQAEILVYLYDQNLAHASEIAESLNIAKQHVSKAIAGFVESGLVCCQPSETDGRSSILALTDEGRKYIEKHLRISDESFRHLLEKMDPDERENFRSSMKYIVALLSRYSN